MDFITDNSLLFTCSDINIKQLCVSGKQFRMVRNSRGKISLTDGWNSLQKLGIKQYRLGSSSYLQCGTLLPLLGGSGAPAVRGCGSDWLFILGPHHHQKENQGSENPDLGSGNKAGDSTCGGKPNSRATSSSDAMNSLGWESCFHCQEPRFSHLGNGEGSKELTGHGREKLSDCETNEEVVESEEAWVRGNCSNEKESQREEACSCPSN